MTRVRCAVVTRGYLRFPHLAGDLLTFVAEDDVWLAPLAGGRAWRITTDRVPASRPRLSPDGRRVAWASTVDGAPEVHVVDLDGGNRRRLTYFGVATTTVFGWTADGRVLVSSHGGEQSRSRRAAYAVDLDGGAPERLPYGFVSNVALATHRCRARCYRRHRRGGVVEGVPRRNGDQTVARPERRRPVPAAVPRRAGTSGIAGVAR